MEASRKVDPEFKSPIWADTSVPSTIPDHHGIIPLPTADPSKFTDHQTKVFKAIAERYLELFNPANAGEESRRGSEERFFSWRHPCRSAIFFGTQIDVFGPNLFVSEEQVHVEVHDAVSKEAWLVIPVDVFSKYPDWHKGTTVDDLIRLNPHMVEHLVETANQLVSPGGRGLWARADGTFVDTNGVRYYTWPIDHLRCDWQRHYQATKASKACARWPITLIIGHEAVRTMRGFPLQTRQLI